MKVIWNFVFVTFLLLSFECIAVDEAHPEFKLLKGKTVEAVVPKGWHVMTDGGGERRFAVGDLDGDRTDDLVVAIEKDGKEASVRESFDSSNDLARETLFFWGAKDGTYKFFRSADNLIVPRSRGGQYSPLADVKIANKVLTIEHFGSFGPSGIERWDLSQKYRYQKGDIYLIGKTMKRFLAVPDAKDSQMRMEDINYSTGDVIETDEDGEMTKYRRNLKPILIDLMTAK